MEHWRGRHGTPFPEGSWEVSDGSLVARSGRIGRDLISRREYSNFELQFEWRIAPGGNSGVKYLVDESLDSPYRSQLYGLLFAWLAMSIIVLYLLRNRRRLILPLAGVAALVAGAGAHQIQEYVRYSTTGLEMQILDNERHANGSDPLKRAGALYGVFAARTDATRPAGEWNTGRVVAAGDSVEHWINGQRVLAYSLDSDDFRARIAASGFGRIAGFSQRRRGRIVLQHHRDEVRFRDVRIRRLELD
jgi:hypothetical protein